MLLTGAQERKTWACSPTEQSVGPALIDKGNLPVAWCPAAQGTAAGPRANFCPGDKFILFVSLAKRGELALPVLALEAMDQRADEKIAQILM